MKTKEKPKACRIQYSLKKIKELIPDIKMIRIGNFG